MQLQSGFGELHFPSAIQRSAAVLDGDDIQGQSVESLHLEGLGHPAHGEYFPVDSHLLPVHAVLAHHLL